jgi:hypothetical protein
MKILGNAVTISGTIETPSDFLAGVVGAATVTISGSITGGNGANGTSSTDPGDDGGSVAIGSPRALSALRTEFPNANSPNVINMPAGASLRGGNGGNGFDDESGKLSGKNLTVRGSNAGRGGNAEIGCGTFNRSGSLNGGNGGKGGTAGKDGKAVAQDGVQLGERGGNVSATAGDGGNMGLVATYINGDNTAKIDDAGHGQNGVAGIIEVKVGNGGPGAPGGNVTASLGVAGTNTMTDVFGVHGAATISGGNGGVSEDPNTAGGDGGNLSISTSDGRRPRARIDVNQFGNGGAGFNGCSVLPMVSGTNGGNGGNVSIGDASGLHADASISGGNGGNGAPSPGAGGKKGTAPAFTIEGQDGAPGGPCSFIPETVVGVGFLAVVLDVDVVPGVLQAGDTIPLIRIDGGRPVPAHQLEGDHGCVNDHLHTQGGSIRVRHRLNNKWTTTPAVPDPDSNKCGFGKIVLVNSPLIQARNGAVK